MCTFPGFTIFPDKQDFGVILKSKSPDERHVVKIRSKSRSLRAVNTNTSRCPFKSTQIKSQTVFRL